MKWTTPIPIFEQSTPIDYSAPTVFLGSCFATNIAAQFDALSLPNIANPFGVVFNPLAIERLITLAVNQEKITALEVFENDLIWNSFLAHSKVYASSKAELIERLNVAIQQLYQSLLEARHLVLTFGTAWVYRHIESDQIVANCHKLPNKKFLKELLSPEQIAQSLEASVAVVRTINPSIVLISTVSPVRHTKDGMVQNAQSKAHLLAGVHQIISPKNDIHYFPAYEIMIDELRDYRFYKADLIHPNEQAVTYIWEKFRDSWFDQQTRETMQEVARLKTAIAHKPIQPESSSHNTFIQQLAHKIALFKESYPHIQL